MEKQKKYITITLLFAVLCIPIFFGVYSEYLFVSEFNVITILVLIIGFFTLLLIGKLIEIYGYNENNIKILEKQDVINSFINNDNKLVVWLFFPMIMVIEV